MTNVVRATLRCQETTHGAALPASATVTRMSANRRPGWLEPVSTATSPAVQKTGLPKKQEGQLRLATMHISDW